MATKHEKIKINQYLSIHSRHRNLDESIIKWCRRKKIDNEKKTVSEWEKLIQNFFSETER